MDNVDTKQFVEWLVTLGVGGILAAFIFVVYRKDIRQYSELWKSTTDQLIIVVKENTISNIKLVNLIETQERDNIRKSDIDSIIERHLLSQKRLE